MFIGYPSNIQQLSHIKEGTKNTRSFIFAGPEYIGKKMLAEALACALITDSPLDVFTVDEVALGQDGFVIEPIVEIKKGISRRKMIDVESVREMKVAIAQSPMLGHCRVCIINDAHMLTTQSQNALLKILEEPYKETFFFLITHLPGALLPTIHSRCQRIEFCSPSREMFFSFEKLAQFPDSDMLWVLALGRPGLAVSLVDDDSLLQQRKEWFEFIASIEERDLIDRFRFAEELAKDREKVAEFLLLWEFFLSDFASKNVNNIASAYAQIEKVEKAIQDLRATNAQARLLLESIFI